jgi:hypothetical protein
MRRTTDRNEYFFNIQDTDLELEWTRPKTPAHVNSQPSSNANAWTRPNDLPFSVGYAFFLLLKKLDLRDSTRIYAYHSGCHDKFGTDLWFQYIYYFSLLKFPNKILVILTF